MISKEDFLAQIEKMSRERFLNLSIKLLDEMGFELTSARSFGGDFEAEAEMKKGEKILEYVVRISRSGGDPSKEVDGLETVLGPGVMGLYITTSNVDEQLAKDTKVDVADAENFYKLAKEYDLLSDFDGTGESDRSLPSASEADRMIDWGDEFFEDRNYTKALEYYDKAIEMKPDSMSARTKKAEVLLQRGEPEKVVNTLLDALDRNIESPNGWTVLGRAYHDMGKYEDEIEAYDRALDINEDHTDAWKNKGATLYEKGMYDEAQLCFDRILEVEPKDESAWNNKGLCLFKKNDLRGALNAVNNALSINPDFIDALLNKALILENQNKISRALRVAEKLTSLRPDNSSFRYIKAAYLEAVGEYEEALKEVNNAIRLDPSNKRAITLRERLRTHLENLSKEVEEGRRESEDVERQLEHEKSYLAHRIEKMEKEIEKLKSLRSVQEDAGPSAEEGGVELRKELVEKDRELDELREEKTRLENEVQKQLEDQEIVTELEGHEEEMGKLKEERGSLREAIDDDRDELDELRAEREALENEVEKLQRKREEKAEEGMKRKEEVEDELKSKQREMEELEKRREEVSSDLEARESEIDELESKKKRLESEIKRMEEEKKVREKRKRETYERLKRIREEERKKNTKQIKKKATLLWKMDEAQKALKLIGGSENEEFMNLIGCCEYDSNQIGAAVTIFDDLDRLDALINLEEMYFELGQYHKSSSVLGEIVRTRSRATNKNTLWEKRGEVLRRLNKHREALESYMKSSELSDGMIEDFVATGSRCNVFLVDMDEEIKRLENILKENDSIILQNLLGSYYYKQRKYKKAIKIFRGIGGHENGGFYNNIGCSAYQLERYGEALSAFEKANKMNPDDPDYINNLGFCQLQRNLVEAARENFERAVELDPEDPVSWYNLGVALKRLDKSDWKEKIDKSLELDPNFEEAKRIKNIS
ncbi:MAG: tetratricopeptide repeat protein [Thermoplasmata archaeon]